MKQMFNLDLASLPVADSAKAVIEGFIEAECSPSIYQSPSKSEKLRRIILKEIHISLKRMRSGPDDSQNIFKLAKRLQSVAKQYRRDGNIFLWNCFKVLSELIKSVAPEESRILL